jgi:hypothetical protein
MENYIVSIELRKTEVTFGIAFLMEQNELNNIGLMRLD